MSGGRRDVYPQNPEPLPFPVYDNHTHLDMPASVEPMTPEQQLDRAEAVGIRGIVQVGCDLPRSRFSADLAERDPRVLAAVAIHPNDAPEYAERGELDAALAELDGLASQPRVRAIGETGLDFFRTPPELQGVQTASFEAHIDIAKRHGLALQIHDRDAHDAVVATLDRVGAPDTVVFHCFSGDEDLARVCAERGWYLSFAGTVTFKNAPNLRRALRVAPLDRVMVETDAPYLTPAPFRGHPNAPYLVPYTLRFMADELDLPVAELGRMVAENTERVYGSWGDGLPAGERA